LNITVLFFSAQESALQEGLLWVGSDDGLVHITKNGGESWENITPKDMPDWMMINSIEPSVFDAGTCYIAGTKYKSGDFSPYLYKTNNYGKTWTKITNGIGSEHFTRVVREDPNRQGLLYAGTETGLYISFNDGKNWKPFQLNLPIVPITDLTIKEDNLIVATQGRSLWILDDLTVIHQLYDSDLQNNILFKPKDTYRMGGRSTKNSKTNGTNLESGVITYFNLNNYNQKDEVSLTYFDAKGDTIKTFSTTSKIDKLPLNKGSNKFVWDMVYDGASSFPGLIMWSGSLRGPRAIPGNYVVSLNVNGEVSKKAFKILKDPRAESSIEDMEKQFVFIEEINNTLDKTHKTIKKIRNINKKLDVFVTQYKDDPNIEDLVETASTLKEAFSAIEKTLYQTKNRSRQDPLNFPIKLNNKLAHLNALVGRGDFAPTDQDFEVKNELTQKINEQLQIFDDLIANDIKSFNALFNAKNLTYLEVEDK